MSTSSETECSDLRVIKIGARIRELRQHRGMTQAELAKRAGISVQCLSQIERGIVDATLDIHYRLAPTLDTSVVLIFTCLHEDEFAKALDRLWPLPASEIADAARGVIAWAKENKVYPFDRDRT